MKLKNHVLRQTIKDIEGEEVIRQILPTKSQLKAAREKGMDSLPIKEDTMSVLWALANACGADLAIKNQQGQVVQPDPHEDVKYELFDIRRNLLSLEGEDSIVLKDEDIEMIKVRCKRIYPTDVYGYIHQVLAGKTPFFIERPVETTEEN